MSGTISLTTSTIQDHLAVGFLQVITALMRILPRKMALSIVSCCGRLFSRIAKRRRIAEYNLRTVLMSQISPKEIHSIVRKSYESIFITIAELLLMKGWSDKTIRSMISYDDEQKILRYLNDSKGVIFVTGHYGNWELMSAFAGVLNYPLSVLVKPLKHPKLEHFLNDIRTSKGARVIYRGAQIRELFKTLKSGGAVGIVADQDAGRNGVFVPLFGRMASCPSGIARMARITGSRIIPVFMRRKCMGKYAVVVCPEIRVPHELPPNEADTKIMSEFCQELENEVRLNPGQWLWQHKRWKSSPERRILSISDGKAGHFKQSQVMVNALSDKLQAGCVQPKHLNMTIEKSSVAGASVLGACFAHLSRWYAPAIKLAVKLVYTHKTWNELSLISADYVVSCGSSTEIANKYLKYRDSAKNCFVQSPQYGTNAFDSVIRPDYDSSTFALNEVGTPGPLIRLCGSDGVSTDNNNRVSLLIGGISDHMRWNDKRLQIMLHSVLDEANRLGWHLNISTSRRTPASTAEMIRQTVNSAKLNFQPSVLFANESNPPGVYEEYLNKSSHILVTADSLSMISEAIATASNVALINLDDEQKISQKVRKLAKQAGLPFIENSKQLRDFFMNHLKNNHESYMKQMNESLRLVCDRMLQ